MSKIFNSKTLAIALSVVMVVCAFCATLSVSADDANLLAGMGYTYTMNAFLGSCTDDSATILTDGAYRGAGDIAWNGISGVAGVTADLAGTYTKNQVEFAFDDATTIGTVVIRGVRAFFVDSSVNRHMKVEAVETTTDGLNYTAATFTAEFAAIADAPLCTAADQETEGAQYYDVTIAVEGAADIMGLRLTLTTERADGSFAYVVQMDEIEAYAPGADIPTRGGAVEDPTSDDTTEESVPSDDTTEESVSSDDTVPSVPVADTTFTVVLAENEDGTYTITAAVPADVDSGKICITVSDDLALVAGSLKSIAGAQKNEAYDRDGVSGVAVTFASDSILDEGTVVFTADYTAAEGAEIDESDITVDLWNLGANGDRIATERDGDVIKEFAPIVPSEPSVVPSEDPTSDDTTEESVSSDDTTEESVSSDDTTEESAPVDKPSTPTGDAGIAVFAVLAVLSGAAVVVLKKRA